MQKDQLFLGIDGGGSKCKAILTDQHNTVLGTGISGPANPVYGMGQAQHSITESASLALSNAKLPNIGLIDIIAGVGLAGVNLPHVHEEMMKWQSPFKSMYLTTDILIACLGAHNDQDGAVIICGTGSCGFSNVNNSTKIVGAHGFPQGDKGSGAWFGLKAVEAVLLSLDEMAPATAITQYIFQFLNVSNADELATIVAGKPASFFAQLAHTIFCAVEAKDDVAIAIVSEGAGYIGKMAKILSNSGPPRISLIGGLAESITPYLDQNIQQQLGPAKFPPEMGAVFLARQEATVR